MSVKFVDKSDEAKARLEKNIAKALTAIGLKFQEIATKEATAMKVVDTGRYRASLSFVTPEEESGFNPEFSKTLYSQEDDVLRGRSKPKSVRVGSGVNYAQALEYGTARMAGRPTIGNAVLNYNDDYKEIVAKILGEGWKISAKI